jgi:hypothetical protein
MGTTQPTEASSPQAQARELQFTVQFGTESDLDKVRAFAINSEHPIVANAPNVIANDTTAGDMPDMQNPSQHDCPLLKLPTELRLEIFRLAFQDYLDVISAPARDFYSLSHLPALSAAELSTGALALLDTCRTLRIEAVDAMEPLANASKSTLQSWIDIVESRKKALSRDRRDLHVSLPALLELDWNLKYFKSNIVKIGQVCSVLALAREADGKIRVGREMD